MEPPRVHALQQEKPPQWETHTPQPKVRSRAPQLENAWTQQWKPSAAKIKLKKPSLLKKREAGVGNVAKKKKIEVKVGHLDETGLLIWNTQAQIFQ